MREVPTLEALVDPLAAWFRLIVPDPPREGGHGPDWIEDLIDGLGAAAVGIVAAGGPKADAWALATRDPDRVRGLVLVGDLPAPATGGGPGGFEGPPARVHILNPALLADGRGLVVITGFLAESARDRIA